MIGHFHSWAAFFHMGGYASFVWPAYAVVAAIVIGLVVYTVVRAKQVRRQLRHQFNVEDMS